MPLPKQVRDQIAEAERISKEIEKENAAAAGGDDTDDGQPPAAQDVTFEASQNETHTAEADQTPPGGDGLPASPEGTGEGESQDPPDQAAGAAGGVGDEGFEQRWRSLQGMYNAEKRRNAELEGRVQGLENMLASLQRAREEAPPPEPKETAPELPQGITADERVAYGDDLVGVIERAAAAKVAEALAPLQEENANLRRQVASVGQRTEQNTKAQLIAKLDASIPGWRELNNDQAFNGWLAEMDVFSRRTRKALLDDALATGDAERVSSFFTTYQKEQAAVSKAVADSPDSTPAKGKSNGKGNGKVDLGTLAAPGRGSAGMADGPPSNGRMIKESEIGDFYRKVAKGEYAGKDQQRLAFEAEIQGALSEGRIMVGQ